jgi:hypothetical protein
MHPQLSQAIAEEHRRDLRRRADRYRRSVATRTEWTQSTRTSLDAKLGWLLIRTGYHLIALRATPAEARAARSF